MHKLLAFIGFLIGTQIVLAGLVYVVTNVEQTLILCALLVAGALVATFDLIYTKLTF